MRCFSQDHTLDNYVALGFNTGRINILKIDIDGNEKLVNIKIYIINIVKFNFFFRTFRSDEIWDVQKKSITSMAWHYYDNDKFCFTYER